MSERMAIACSSPSYSSTASTAHSNASHLSLPGPPVDSAKPTESTIDSRASAPRSAPFSNSDTSLSSTPVDSSSFTLRLPVNFVPTASPGNSAPPSNYGIFGLLTTKRSDKYWFEDGSVVIKVGDTTYKLYKGILNRQSKLLSSKITAVLQSPPVNVVTTTYTYGGGKGKKGRDGSSHVESIQPGPPQLVGAGSESDPVVLDVKKSDFESLLSYMFPADYEYDFAPKEWFSITSVAEKLEFKSIQAVAMGKVLKNSSPLDLIDIGRKQNNHECYLEGFRLICTRETSLALEEGRHLGVDCIIAIAQARDMLAKGFKWSALEPLIQFEVEAEAKPKEAEELPVEEKAFYGGGANWGTFSGSVFKI